MAEKESEESVIDKREINLDDMISYDSSQLQQRISDPLKHIEDVEPVKEEPQEVPEPSINDERKEQIIQQLFETIEDQLEEDKDQLGDR